MKRYKYYQPNKLDLKDEYGDCTIRAMCKIFEKEWAEVFEMLIPLIRKYQIMPNYMFYAKNSDKIAEDIGLVRGVISVKRGKRRPTVAEFAKTHPTGKYIAKVAHHVVAVVDGCYFDTWDCGDCSMYSYYELRG